MVHGISGAPSRKVHGAGVHHGAVLSATSSTVEVPHFQMGTKSAGFLASELEGAGSAATTFTGRVLTLRKTGAFAIHPASCLS